MLVVGFEADVGASLAMRNGRSCGVCAPMRTYQLKPLPDE